MTDPDNLNGFAVDLGGTKIAAARIEHGIIQDRKFSRTDGQATPEDFMETMASMLSEIGYKSGDPLGAAITGRVDGFGNWHAVNKATLTEVTAIPIAKYFTDKIGPATVANDAAAATFAEAKIGAGKGCENFGFVTVSTGVGGGLFLGGRLHQTANGLAGHIGFISSSHGQDMCGSGRLGTVESVASGNAIARAADASGQFGLDAREVFQRAKKAQSWADALVDRSAHAIADLCADLTVSLGLETIILGGSIGLADTYIEQVTKHLNQQPEFFQTKLIRSPLGHDGPLLGALLLAAHGSD